MGGKHDRWLGRDEGEGDLATRSVRAGSFAGAAQVGRAVIELAATVILARLLLPEEFGLVGMVVAFTGFLVLFKDLGLSTATIQRPDISQSDVSALFLLNVGAGTVLTLLCAVLAPVLAWFYDEPRLLDITLALSVAFLIGALGVQHHALLRRQLKFGRIAAVEITAAVVGVGVGVAAAVAGWGYWALVARALASEIVAGIAPWLLCSWRPGVPRFDARVKELAAFGGNITAFGVVNYFARNLDDILIGRLFGPAILGFYQKAYELLMLPLRQINNPIGAVALPALSELDPQSERYRAAYLRILEKLLLVTSLVGGILCGTADWVVVIVLGEQWLPAAPIFAWLGLLVFTQPIGNTVSWLFITQDRTSALLRWGVVGSALAVISFLVGLSWGAVGVAACYAISGVVVRTPLLLWYVTRSGPVTLGDFAAVTIPYLSAGVAVVSAVIGLRAVVGFDSNWVGLGASIATAIVVYAAFMVAIPRCRAAVVDSVVLARMLSSARSDESK